MELWPLEVSEVSYVSAQASELPAELLRSSWVIKIRVQITRGDLSLLPFEKLCFHLSGDFLTAHTLYEWLGTYDPEKNTPVFLKLCFC